MKISLKWYRLGPVRIRLKCPKCKKTSHVEIPAPVQSAGGKARMAKITPEERLQNAQKAARTRRKNREGLNG